MSYPNIKFQTDQSGANKNICFGTGVIFNFSLTTQSNLVSADIVIKKGSSTSDNISVSIYDQSNGGGNLVALCSVDASSITQSYETIIFQFNNVLLFPNISYSLVLSSTTSCTGSDPYSMKSGNFQVLNSETGLLLNTGYGISSNVSSVSTLSSNLNVVGPTPTPTSTNALPTSPTSTPTPTPSNTSNFDKQPNIGNKRAILRLGVKNPKIYRGSSLIYNPNNN
jgi:hypothetical protein